MPFGMEKLEWCGCPMVKTFEDFLILTEYTNVTGGQMDRQHMMALAALMHSIMW